MQREFQEHKGEISIGFLQVEYKLFRKRVITLKELLDWLCRARFRIVGERSQQH